MGKIIRKLRIEDIFAVGIFEQRYFADSAKFSLSFINFIHDPQFSFVCERRGRIIGIIKAERWKNVVTINTLCVDEKFSSRGLGRELLEKCIESIRSVDKAISINLMVCTESKMAIKLYRSLGFEVDAMERKVYFDGNDGFIMKLKS